MVPVVSTPTNKDEFLQQRDRLINADRALRRDRVFADSFSDVEKMADKIMRTIRAEEALGIWREDHPNVPHPFPGMEFLAGRKIAERTKTLSIIKQMPKGAVLHVHLGGMLDVRDLLKMALEHPAIHVRVPHRLTAENISSTLPEFMPLPLESYPLNFGGITSMDYIPNTWVNIAQARESFDMALGGPSGFDKWFESAATVNPSEAYGTHNTTDKIWEKFESTFAVTSNLIRFLPVFKAYIQKCILIVANDGVYYIEIRFDFLFPKGVIGADGKSKLTSREVVIAFAEAVRQAKASLEEQGYPPDKFIGAKIIYTPLKFVAPKDLYWHVDECILLKKEFPYIIAGFDLVGHEDNLHPIIDYIEPLLYLRKRQAEEELEIPFLFHAGETLGDGNTTDNNVYDAILLGTKRIGHGFSLVKHPKLMDICRELEILLEVCPISNEVLRLTSSMPMHPLPILLNNGIPVALSPDSPSTFGNMGVSYDFYQVFVSSEISGLSTLGILARDSILFSMMSPKEKTKTLAIWEADWKEYLQFIVDNHSKNSDPKN